MCHACLCLLETAPSLLSCLLWLSVPEMVARLVSSFYFLVIANTKVDRKTKDSDKRRHHKTKTHKMHSAQLVLPLFRSVPCVLVCGSLSSSSNCPYLTYAALSRATCSARSLNLTVSNCQGPALLGGIWRGGWVVWSRENDREARKGRFESVEVALCELYGFCKGGLRFGDLFFGHSTAWLNNLITHILTRTSQINKTCHLCPSCFWVDLRFVCTIQNNV